MTYTRVRADALRVFANASIRRSIDADIRCIARRDVQVIAERYRDDRSFPRFTLHFFFAYIYCIRSFSERAVTQCRNGSRECLSTRTANSLIAGEIFDLA